MIGIGSFKFVVSAGLLSILVTQGAYAKNPIKSAFLDLYPDTDGSVLTDVPSYANHCGLCHFNFAGGGNRNPYGAAIEAERQANGKDSTLAIQTIASQDSDGDGYPNETEITDTTTYGNTPSFPGLKAGNIGSVSSVDISDISDYLTPSSGVDTTDPSVTVFSPNGGETATGNQPTTITWVANDASGISSIEIYVSLDGGDHYTPIAKDIPNTGSYTWYAPNRPTTTARIKVEAIDNAFNEGEDESDADFTVESPPGGIAPTTLRDFDLPGSQPLEDSGLPQEQPSNCANCHGGYSAAHEPYRNWMGSMMAQAGIDPIFKANMSIANQDAPDSGDLCLRCHNSRGWLDGRSTPTDGSQMTADDQAGVSCDLCHRMVDPVYKPGISPAEDEEILEELEHVPENPGNGMYVFDPYAHRRGPFAMTNSPHAHLHSPWHSESEMCGTCHDVSNPVFVRDGDNAEYVHNNFNEPPATNSSNILMPVERTYSEWLNSAYNTSNGVFAPQFAGNKSDGIVASCQDCHMSDILGYGANPGLPYAVPERPDLPWHDMTGGSTWISKVLPGYADLDAEVGQALTNGAYRAEYMLKKAARMQAEKVDGMLKVLVINDTGHKLPSGYPEGRRMWVNVRFFDDADNLLVERGGYDPTTGVLTNDTQIYEVHPGIGTNLATTLNVLNPDLQEPFEPGPSLHFVLNNQIYEDNRIPPRGFTNAAFETFGGAPVGHHYDDGQYWDETFFALPDGAVRAQVRLYYQSTSKEFIEFLRDENTTDSNGQDLYDLWEANGKCPPTLMTEAVWPENFRIQSLDWLVSNELGIYFNSISGYTYWVEYTDDLAPSNLLWKNFIGNGMLDAAGTNSMFLDDFSPATSGGESATGHRFYRIMR